MKILCFHRISYWETIARLRKLPRYRVKVDTSCFLLQRGKKTLQQDFAAGHFFFPAAKMFAAGFLLQRKSSRQEKSNNTPQKHKKSESPQKLEKGIL